MRSCSRLSWARLPVIAAAVTLPVALVATAPRAGPLARDALKPPCTPEPGSKRVGKVLETHGEAYQGKKRLRRSTPLRMNAMLCTGPGGPRSGRVKFVIELTKRTTCELRPGSRVRLYPPKSKGSKKQPLIRFELGKTYCATGKGPNKEVLFEARKGRVKVLTKDPSFAIDATKKKTVVKVKVGTVTVKGTAGRAVVVAAGQQTTVPPSGAAQKPAPLQETAEDKKGFGEVKAALPKIDFSRPDADGSAALKRIFARDEIRVAFDAAPDTGADSYDFWDSFFALLAEKWKISFYSASGTTAEILKDLRSGDYDLVTTSVKGSLGQFDTMPLFTDSGGADWYVGLVSDKTFLEALRSFLRAAVNGGQYSSLYRLHFDREPSLQLLSPVLNG